VDRSFYNGRGSSRPSICERRHNESDNTAKYDSHFNGHTWHLSLLFWPGLSVGIPSTDTSSVPYTGFVTELLETYATEAKAKYAMESKYGFSLKLTGTKPKRHSGKISNYNCAVCTCGLHVRLTCNNKTYLWTIGDVSKKHTILGTQKDVHTHPNKSDFAKAWTNDTLLNKERGLPKPFKVIIDSQLESNSSITVVDYYCNLQRKFHDSDVKRLRMKVTDGDEI
jgi:hypothetical protein